MDFFGNGEVVLHVVDGLRLGDGGGGSVAQGLEGFLRGVENELGVVDGVELFPKPVKGAVGSAGDFVAEGEDGLVEKCALLFLKFGLKAVGVDDGGKPGLGHTEVSGDLGKLDFGVGEHEVHNGVVPVGDVFYLWCGGGGGSEPRRLELLSDE